MDLQEIARSQAETETQGTSAADLHGLWYPTVRRTVHTLSKLYRCLDLEVFQVPTIIIHLLMRSSTDHRASLQGLCQEILGMCVESLLDAEQKMRETRKPLDASLFLVKHLLIVREQTAPFRGSMTQRETRVDFSRLGSALTQGNWFALGANNALLELLTAVPAHVTEEKVRLPHSFSTSPAQPQ